MDFQNPKNEGQIRVPNIQNPVVNVNPDDGPSQRSRIRPNQIRQIRLDVHRSLLDSPACEVKHVTIGADARGGADDALLGQDGGLQTRAGFGLSRGDGADDALLASLTGDVAAVESGAASA